MGKRYWLRGGIIAVVLLILVSVVLNIFYVINLNSLENIDVRSDDYVGNNEELQEPPTSIEIEPVRDEPVRTSYVLGAIFATFAVPTSFLFSLIFDLGGEYPWYSFIYYSAFVLIIGFIIGAVIGAIYGRIRKGKYSTEVEKSI